MRPLRLTVEGFTSFRDHTEVDFGDADYFALVGPTGSGKSSLIDAITFALYGCVPRYDDRRLVAPIITQGRVEARVGLDFAVGPDRYRAVRVVRASGRASARTSARPSAQASGQPVGGRGGRQAMPKGATTKEARLERLGPPAPAVEPDPEAGEATAGVAGEATVIETLAGDAEGVTAAVTQLLGLSFEHFIKCVVLPQGAFARFLHDKPSARQDLLVELLGLGVYAEIGQRANQLGAASANRAALVDQQLARPPLRDATPEARGAAQARLEELRHLQATLRADEPILDERRQRQAAAESAAASARARQQALAAVAGAVPDDVDQVLATLEAARQEEARAASDVERADQAALQAETTLAELPRRSDLERATRAHTERDDLVARIDTGQRQLQELAASVAVAATALEHATAALAGARADQETAFRTHQAAALTQTLQAGTPCPVCHQPVKDVPHLGRLPDLDRAADALNEADKLAAEAADAHHEAAIRRGRGEEKLLVLTERLAGLDAELAEHPDATVVATALAAVVAAEDAAVTARRAVGDARGRATQTGEVYAQRQRDLAGAWDALDRVRDGVAALAPPAADRRDLSGAWGALVAWAAERGPAEQQAAAEAEVLVAQLAADQSAHVALLAEQSRAAGIEVSDVGGRPLGELAAAAVAAADAELSRLEAAIGEVESLRAEAAAAQSEGRVAHALAQHLRSSGFERWLLDEVLAELVAGATTLLRDLSSGAYSLTLDDAGGFAVVDHRNAELVRSARTLSGGESFLASLALALALADRLSGFAAEGAAPLEAIFLDEGFGTLDPDTLDTVAAAIENLAAEGRVVGLVTHVRDLAERIPVRYEVEKGPTTSTVRRVEG